MPRKRAALFRRRRVLIPPFTLVILLDAGEDVGTLLNWSIPGSSILPHDLGGETALATCGEIRIVNYGEDKNH